MWWHPGCIAELRSWDSLSCEIFQRTKWVLQHVCGARQRKRSTWMNDPLSAAMQPHVDPNVRIHSCPGPRDQNMAEASRTINWKAGQSERQADQPELRIAYAAGGPARTAGGPARMENGSARAAGGPARTAGGPTRTASGGKLPSMPPKPACLLQEAENTDSDGLGITASSIHR